MKNDIIKGHVNELLKKEEDLFKERIIICKTCPLYFKSFAGPLCNGTLWINKDNKTSTIKKDGYVRGCGCRLDAKLRIPNATCIIKKW